MNQNDITQTTLTFALEEGFDQAGCAPAAPVRQPERFTDWICQGFHHRMHWISRTADKRLNPLLLFPSARSAVVCALNYYNPGDEIPSPDVSIISRYARGMDYHNVIMKKLKNVLSRLQATNPSIEGRCYVDTAPVMEKYWAVQAGIGWQGKHSVIISPIFGSWVFLGVILINQEMIYNSPLPLQCGDCSLCIQACPTNALEKPFMLNAGKCISYWTIENSDPDIPEEVSSKLCRYIYGCDICQNVCPWNQRLQKATGEPCFTPVNTTFRLSELNLLNNDNFMARFAGTAIERAGYEQLKRNAKHLFFR